MHARQATRIIGDEIDVYQKGSVFVAEVNLTDTPVDVATVSVSDARMEGAIRKLVLEAYRVRCRVVAKRQKYRCAECDALKPLEFDHQILRSHGRSDRCDNILGKCTDCHRRRHEKSGTAR